MTKPIVRIHDLSTNEVIDREMTAAEYKEHQANQAEQALIKAEAEAKVTAKAALLSKLAALGLTTDDLRALGL